MREIECHVYGKVQGVNYRIFAKKKADKFGVFGYISNCEDGSVEVVAQGEEEALREFERVVCEGPTFAEVNSCEVMWQDRLQDAFTEFEIR